jgi:hypothetical protein
MVLNLDLEIYKEPKLMQNPSKAVRTLKTKMPSLTFACP